MKHQHPHQSFPNKKKYKFIHIIKLKCQNNNIFMNWNFLTIMGKISLNKQLLNLLFLEKKTLGLILLRFESCLFQPDLWIINIYICTEYTDHKSAKTSTPMFYYTLNVWSYHPIPTSSKPHLTSLWSILFKILFL